MVEMPSGETAYTRAGSLQLSPDGDIVTADGYIVQPGITVPTDAVSISVNESGAVYVDLDGQVAPVRVGQLELANFANQAGPGALAQHLLPQTAASDPSPVPTPGPAGLGRSHPGALTAAARRERKAS